MRESGLTSWLLIYNLSGEGVFRYPGGEWRTKPGDAVLFPSGFVRDYGATRNGSYRRFYAEFHPRAEWHELLQWPELARSLRHLSIRTESARHAIERTFAEAIALGLSHHPRREAFARNALEKILLWCDTENPHGKSALIDPRIRRALDHLTQHLAEPITLAALARHCGLSVSRLSWLFHHATGTSPLQYLEICRMNRARQLLRLTPNPIQDIAAEVGYPDPFYFSMRFKRHTGKCPRAFRQAA